MRIVEAGYVNRPKAHTQHTIEQNSRRGEASHEGIAKATGLYNTNHVKDHANWQDTSFW